jgi:lipoprotein LprG
MTCRRPRALTCLVAAAALLSACSGGAGEDRNPQEVLAEAKTILDETSGVRITLETQKLPPSVDGIVSATGVGTHDPAFEGDLTVATGGITADVPVVAAQGKVFAKLPFTTEYVEVDPAAYGAPDPAGLMEPEGGLSSLLSEVDSVEEGEQVRSGEDVLSTYRGTVPGDAVASIVPSASPDGAFDATFTVDDGNRLREAELTGPFYPQADGVTYTITFEEYGTSADITVP